jgi:ankyrin repeat protein
MTDPLIQQQFLNSLESGDLERSRELLAAGADVNLRGGDPDGETPLMRAIATGKLSIVQLLIEAGADVNCAGLKSSWTPLIRARESPAIMRALIVAGADVNARAAPHEMISPASGRLIRRGGETALHLAAATNSVEAVRILIQAGADIEARAENGLAPLDYAVKLGSPTEASVMLVEAGAEMTPQRFEAMHSTAHGAHSDLWQFPWTPEPNPPPPTTAKKGQPPQIPDGEIRCPNCDALLYSRKSRICGHCKAILPPELFLSEVQATHEGRQWARDLADSFAPDPSVVRRPVETNSRNPSPAELVRPTDAEEQLTRSRPPLVFYVAPAFVAALITFSISRNLGMAEFIGMLGIVVGYAMWRRASRP